MKGIQKKLHLKMGVVLLIIFLLVVLIFLSPLVKRGIVGEAIAVNNCRIIDQPGDYDITQVITAADTDFIAMPGDASRRGCIIIPPTVLGDITLSCTSQSAGFIFSSNADPGILIYKNDLNN